VVRRALLAAAGIPVEAAAADIDERRLEQSAAAREPTEIAMLLARAKAKAVAPGKRGRPVVGADQTLALGDQRFSKPASRDAARAQLKALRGKTHALHSGVAVVRDDEVLFEHCDSARLTMRAFSDEFIETYLDAAGNEASASVGGYQLEKTGVHLFERIDGDHFTILGLPLLPLLAFLRGAGLVAE
jgi:septum formation protein